MASAADLVAQLDALSNNTSTYSGAIVELVLSPGDYELPDTLVFDRRVVASALRLVAPSTGAATLRLATGTGRRLSSATTTDLIRTSPGAPHLFLRGLQLRGAAVRLNRSHATFEDCTFADADATATTTEGGALSIVGGSVVEATRCDFISNRARRAGAVFVDGGAADFASCRFEGNEATDGGSAILVRSTIRPGVVLRQHTLLVGNGAPSVMGVVRYALPAPRGRWIDAPGGDEQLLNNGAASDFPFACAPGVSGERDSTEDGGSTNQNGLQCTAVCPAGKMCPGAAAQPEPCSRGGYCAGGNPAATPCPAGTHSNTTGLNATEQCTPCPPGHACLTGPVAPAVCGTGSFAASEGADACQRCSAGSFQASEGETACEACTSGSWCASGSSAPTPCGSGTHGDSPGLQSAADCLSCPEGFWCSAGSRIACGLGTYNDATGADDQSYCQYCPPNSFTDGESKARLDECTCDAGYFALWSSNGSLTCDICPVGANCSASGSRLTALPLREGYWRANAATVDVRRCPGGFIGSGCVGGPGGACKAGLEGPYCAFCSNRTDFYYDRDKRECRMCNAANSAPLIGVAVGGVLACCALSLTAWFLRKRRRQLRGDDAPLAGKKEAWWRRHAIGIQRRLKVKVKIRWSFYQIVTKVSETYMVAFLASVESALVALSFSNLELDGLGLPLACVKLSGFRSTLLFMMLAPIGVLLCTEVAGWFRRDRSHEREHQRMQEAGSISHRRSSKLRVAFRQSRYKALPMALRVTFLAFPTVSSLAFKAFRCDDLDTEDGVKMGVMSADFAVSCWDEDGDYTAEYQRIRHLAIVAIVLYPVCVPCLYLGLFYRVRHAVWSETPTGFSEAISFLTEEYDAAFFFWELVEVLKKLLLVGAMSVAMPGTLNQLVLAFIIVLIFLVALLVAKPYKRPEDDVIALAVGFALVMFFFFSLILKVQTLTEAVKDSLTGQLTKNFAIDNSTNTALLLASTLGALVLGSVMMVIEISAAAAIKAKEVRRQAAMARELEELRERNRATAAERESLRSVLAQEQVSDVVKRSMIEVDEIKFSKTKLGGGTFGEVWRASLNGTPVAVKKLHRNKLDEANLKMFRAEFELQLSLRHPNLVQVLGGCWSLEDVNVCIVLELCAHGTLSSVLEDEPTRSTLSWARHKLPMASGIARAMAYLHGQRPPVVHRDLKPENVLVDEGFTAKIADFGSSREMDLHKTMETAGTPLYSAPELLRKEHYDEKVDLWSFACVLECLHTHCDVYGDAAADGGAAELIWRIANDEVRPSAKGLLADIVDRCSRVDSMERCSFAEAVEMLGACEIARQATRLPPGPSGALPAPVQSPPPLPETSLPPAGASASASGMPSASASGMPTNRFLANSVVGAATEGESSNAAAETSTLARLARKKSILHGWNDDGAGPSKEGAGRVSHRRYKEQPPPAPPQQRNQRLPAATLMPAIDFMTRLRSRRTTAGDQRPASETELPKCKDGGARLSRPVVGLS